jgi:CubicO group peptidase (beta-lactamase class C family)
LRHTAGLGYDFGNSIVTPFYQKADFFSEENRTLSLKQVIDTLVTFPLAYEPGITWMYSMGLDVIGRVVEIVSGMPLDQFFDQRIFRPLGMKDTAFWARSGVDRLAWPLATLEEMKQAEMDLRTTPPRLFEGGGGLVSTAEDYYRFCEMLLNDGEFNGVRILKPESAKAMHTNQLPPGTKRTGLLNQHPSDGFGLSVEISGRARLTAEGLHRRLLLARIVWNCFLD